MAGQVVIDKDVLGWGIENEKRLRSIYGEILQVGKHQDLQQRSFDENIAAYCKQNNCDLITGDARSYTHFFRAAIKWVRITEYDWWKKADKPIYLVQIEKS